MERAERGTARPVLPADGIVKPLMPVMITPSSIGAVGYNILSRRLSLNSPQPLSGSDLGVSYPLTPTTPLSSRVPHKQRQESSVEENQSSSNHLKVDTLGSKKRQHQKEKRNIEQKQEQKYQQEESNKHKVEEEGLGIDLPKPKKTRSKIKLIDRPSELVSFPDVSYGNGEINPSYSSLMKQKLHQDLASGMNISISQAKERPLQKNTTEKRRPGRPRKTEMKKPKSPAVCSIIPSMNTVDYYGYPSRLTLSVQPNFESYGPSPYVRLSDNATFSSPLHSGLGEQDVTAGNIGEGYEMNAHDAAAAALLAPYWSSDPDAFSTTAALELQRQHQQSFADNPYYYSHSHFHGIPPPTSIYDVMNNDQTIYNSMVGQGQYGAIEESPQQPFNKEILDHASRVHLPSQQGGYVHLLEYGSAEDVMNQSPFIYDSPETDTHQTQLELTNLSAEQPTVERIMTPSGQNDHFNETSSLMPQYHETHYRSAINELTLKDKYPKEYGSPTSSSFKTLLSDSNHPETALPPKIADSSIEEEHASHLQDSSLLTEYSTHKLNQNEAEEELPGSEFVNEEYVTSFVVNNGNQHGEYTQ